MYSENYGSPNETWLFLYAINRLQDLRQNGMTRCQEYAGVVMDSFLLSVQSTLEQVIM